MVTKTPHEYIQVTQEYIQETYEYILVYLNGNNAAEGENNIKYANSYPLNWTVKNWFALDKFESLW